MALAAVALTCMLVAFLAHGARLAAAVTAARSSPAWPPCARSHGGPASSWQRDPDAPGRARPGTLGGPGGRLTRCPITRRQPGCVLTAAQVRPVCRATAAVSSSHPYLTAGG